MIEWDDEISYPTCQICGVVLDRMDDDEFTCNDIRCIRAWENKVDEAEERRIQRILAEQEREENSNEE